MIGVFLMFKDIVNLAIFLILSLGIGCWVYRRLKNKRHVSVVPFVVANIGILLIWSRISGLDMDEVEHLHCAWMVSQGLTPFVDFWQHHSPLLWVMLAPLMKLMPQTALVFEISRLFGACIYVLTGTVGWSIAKKIWGREAQLSVYLLLLTSMAILGEYFWLRPDILSVLLLLACVRVSFDIPGNRYAPSFFAGVSFALAMSFITKQPFLGLLGAIVIVRERHRRWPVKLLCWGSGFAFGAVPLLWYVISNHIGREFIYWTLIFNSRNLMVSVVFPLAFVWAGILAVPMLFRRYRAGHDLRFFTAITAVILSTAGTLHGFSPVNGGYYLAFWFVIVAVAASAVPIGEMISSNRPAALNSGLIGIFLALLIFPNIYETRLHEKSYFSDDKKAVSRILDYSRGGHCVVFLPLHPVFVRDATRLYSDWQFRFVEKYEEVRDDAKREGIARMIISSSPAVVACRYGKRDFILELFQRKLITSAEYKELVAFLTANYSRQQIGKDEYYISTDALAKTILFNDL